MEMGAEARRTSGVDVLRLVVDHEARFRYHAEPVSDREARGQGHAEDR